MMLIKKAKKEEIVEKCRKYQMREGVSCMSDVINEAMFLAEEEIRRIYDLVIVETESEVDLAGRNIFKLLKQKMELLESEN